MFLYGQTTVKLKHHTINTLFFYIKSHLEKPEKNNNIYHNEDRHQLVDND